MSGSPPPSRHRRRHHRHQQHHESQSHSHEQQAAADQRAAPRQPQAPGEAASVAEREGAVSGAEPAGRPPTGASHIRGSQGTPASSDAARQHSGSDLDEGNSDSSGHHSGGSQHSTRQQTRCNCSDSSKLHLRCFQGLHLSTTAFSERLHLPTLSIMLCVPRCVSYWEMYARKLVASRSSGV